MYISSDPHSKKAADAAFFDTLKTGNDCEKQDSPEIVLRHAETYAHVRPKSIAEAGERSYFATGAKIAFYAGVMQTNGHPPLMMQGFPRFSCAETVQKCLSNTKDTVCLAKYAFYPPNLATAKPLTNTVFTATISPVRARSSAG